jgi:outer membrane murein-binding lipoprotein Lpp
MMTCANVWTTNARTVVATIAAALLGVLTLASVAGAACQLPVGDVRDDRLAETVRCLNEHVQLLEQRLETERMRNSVSETIARDVKARLDMLEQDRARSAAPAGGNGR